MSREKIEELLIGNFYGDYQKFLFFTMRTKLLILFLFFSTVVYSNSPSGYELAGNLKSYPYLEIEPPLQSLPPEGYVPFHLEHYGRHGSRWLLGDEDYSVPVEKLAVAEKTGKLTPLGEKTLSVLRQIQASSKGRLGELSDKGALQHQAIGRRMAKNYPDIFTPEADLSAKATIVIRCIISMANALEGIQNEIPGLHFDIDASQADMWFMNYDDKPAWKLKDSVAFEVLSPYRDSLLTSDSYLDRLVNDPQFARDSVAPGLLPRLYWVLGNTQSHLEQPWIFEEVFSEEELQNQWKAGNAGWFIHGGNSRLTDGRMPFVQRKLLNRIIERTDSSIVSGKPGANLRFGHDGILISLITLMEIGGYGDEINSLEELENSDWKDYEIIPMAGNVQLVFYRPSDKIDNLTPDDILVKAMINEREVSMPAPPVSGNYYRWSDLRDYYLGKLKKFD